jgi:hypothetical protein
VTSRPETYGEAARERDLLRASVDLAVPKLVKARQMLASVGNTLEVDEPLRRAIHDLTVGVD